MDEQGKHLYHIISSVSGIGPVTALQIIISTNEFQDISDPKKLAFYAGVALFEKESGNVIRKARGQIKKLSRCYILAQFRP